MSSPTPTTYTIGGHDIVRHLAQGGMASIYTVRCPDTGELRVMKLAGTTDMQAARFEEIHTQLKRLDHPNLVPVRGVGQTEDGRPFLIFDLFEGEPAQLAVRAAGTPGQEARTHAVITIGIQLADVLGYLHDHGFVHCDIKSANVLVTTGQDTRLIDFGSAVFPGEARSTGGAFVGTYTYAAPEQIRREAVDGRADIYAMGVLLYRLFSGRRPFDSKDPAKLARMHLRETAPPMSAQLVDISPDIRDLISRMLAKDPADRPQQAKEIAAVLRAS